MLSPEALRKIDRELTKYPADQRQSAVMAALAIAQGEKGFLTPEVMAFVASYLGMPPIAVEEVASFYTMYDTRPVGRYKLCTCSASSASAGTRPRRTAASRCGRASASARAATRRSCWSTTSGW
jgi:NADH:ubiquinone oxidoreductase subunit E